MADPSADRVAWVFPGQGSQRVGMGRELAAADGGAASVFALADATLGFGLSEVVFDGPADALQETPTQQPAILATSLAYLAVLRERGALPPAAFVAGHSLGEYAAMVAADALEPADALRLVRRRGLLMQEHGGGAMAAIIGLSSALVTEIAQEAGVEVANENTPDQTIVSGRAEPIGRAMALALERGAKRALPLPVSAAFHSSLMAPVVDALGPDIDGVPLRCASIPLVANVDARVIREPDDLRRELRDQICAPVRWVDVVRVLSAAGITTFYEIGPGKVLAGLIARCAPGATVVTAESLL